MPPEPVFRDPPPPAERAVQLELAIARILVRAPRLPVEVPAFDLTLLGLTVDPGEIWLHFGRQGHKVASFSLSWPDGNETIVVRGRLDGLHRLDEDQRRLAVIEVRLRHAIDRRRWAEVSEVAQELLDLPRHVPFDAFRQLVPGSVENEGLVRTGFHCNQDCGLCWQGRGWGRFPAQQILTWIDDLRAAGAQKLVISGGEPTIDPDLPRYIRHAVEIGLANVAIETNAIQLAKPGAAAALKEAGLHSAFVSLHTGDPAVSDRITNAPGTHARTIRGIQALLDAGIPVWFNAVITRDSLATLPELPRFIRRTFGSSRHLRALVISDLGSTFQESLRPAQVPDPDEVRAALPRVIDAAADVWIHLAGLGDPCGPPPCMYGADARLRDPAAPPVDGPLRFRAHGSGCDRCAAKPWCYGMRASHFELFGDRAIAPLATLPRI